MDCPEIWRTIKVYKKLFQGYAKMSIEFESKSHKMRYITSGKSLLIWNTKMSVVVFGIISSLYSSRCRLAAKKQDLIWIGALQGYIGLVGILVLLMDIVVRLCGSELVHGWNSLLQTIQVVNAGNVSYTFLEAA